MKMKKETVFAFFAVLIGLGLNKFVGLFYFHNRPFMDNIGHSIGFHIAENSFPSDHTTFIFSIAFTLFLFSNTKKIAKYLIILSFLGGFARVYIGVHYPLDILGGIIISLFTSTLIFFFSNYKF